MLKFPKRKTVRLRSYAFPQKLWRSLSRNIDASACFPAVWIMKTAPFCLSFPPTPASFLGSWVILVQDYAIALFRFPVLVTHLAKSISASQKLTQFPYLFFCLPCFISFPGPFLFFLSVPSCCAAISPVSIRRTGKELH